MAALKLVFLPLCSENFVKSQIYVNFWNSELWYWFPIKCAYKLDFMIFFVKTKTFEFDCNGSIWEMLTQRKNSLFKEIGLCFWEQDPFWSSLLLRSISGSFWEYRDDSILRNFSKKLQNVKIDTPKSEIAVSIALVL